MAFKVTPLLSIITISYKDPAGLALTARSLGPLLGGSLAWEQIVVDGSPDENAELLQNLREKQWPLTHVPQSPRGIYQAMNEGIAHAKGKYLWFLNGGDQLKCEASIRKIVDFLGSHPEFSAACGAAELHRNGVFQYVRWPVKGAMRLLGMNRVCHQAVVYRRESFDELGPFREEYALAADYEHHLRFDLKGKNSACLPEILVLYDMGGRSDNYGKVFREFRKIHVSLEGSFSRWEKMGHFALLYAEWIRVSIFKAVGNTPLSKVLKPVWHAWQKAKRGAA